MKIRDEYCITYVNYPLTNNKKKHIKFFNKNDVTDVWDVKINAGNLLKQKFDVGSDKIENQRYEIVKNVLTQIVCGTSLYEIDGLRNISDEVNKNQPRKRFIVKTDKKGMEILAESEILGPLQHENEGVRLYNLACHSLIHFLKVRDNIDRLKRCPHCPKFFIARDMKREICYDSKKCFREQKKIQKRKQIARKKKNNSAKIT